MRTLPFLVALVLADPAAGGAWLREDGTGFLAYSGVYNEDGRLDGSLYLEYGFRPKLTLGAKVDIDMTDGRAGDGTAFLFGRKAIPTGERRFKLAYEFGIGSTFGDDSEMLLRTGLSYGRGITLWNRNGWVAVDSAVEWALQDGNDTAKLDATFGLTLNHRFKVMMQAFYSETDGASTTTLAPSVIWQRNKETPSYQLGVEAKEGEFALKLGVWRTF